MDNLYEYIPVYDIETLSKYPTSDLLRFGMQRSYADSYLIRFPKEWYNCIPNGFVLCRNQEERPFFRHSWPDAFNYYKYLDYGFKRD